MTTNSVIQESQHRAGMLSSQVQGLSESEVALRHARGQGNVAPLKTSRSYVQIVRENVFMFVNTIMFILIVALFFLGQYSDAIVSMGVVSFNVIISVVQEIRAKRTLDHIALLTRPKVTVIRDHPHTVAALARQAGFGSTIGVVSGEEIASMKMTQLTQVAEETTVFGRITPQQKAQLVQVLRNRGHHVAMIGDGVNDVFSLKQANLGIAIQSGSAATRGVADIVLLQNSFAALPQVFAEGQRIRNGMHAILQLFLTRVAYMAILVVATMVIDGFPFVPKQNAILTLVTEGIPTVALAAWARPGEIQRHDLLRSFLHFILPTALTLSLAGLGVYVAALIFSYQAAHPGSTDFQITPGTLAVAQSALTTFAVICGLLLIPYVVPPTRAWVGGNGLSGDRRPLLLALGLLLGYSAMLAIAPLRGFFELAPLAMSDYLLIGIVAGSWAVFLRWTWRMRLLERFLSG